MNTNEIKLIKIEDIKVKAGRRPVNPEKVDEYAGSMKIIGLLSPINLTAENELIAGAHRLEAAKILGWDTIPAIINNASDLEAELAEIDENLMRHGLHYLEVGELAIRRDQILEDMGLRAKAGDNQFTGGEKEFTTTADIAKEIGVSERTLQQNKQLAKYLTSEAKAFLLNSKKPRQQALELCRLVPKMQNQIIDLFIKSKAESVSDAVKKLYEELSWIEARKIMEDSRKLFSCLIYHYSDLHSIEKLYAKNDSNLFLWINQKFINRANDLLKQWEFEYRHIIVWDKGDHCEFCFVGIKGNPSNDNTFVLPYIIREPEKTEGTKPEIFYELVNDICNGENKIEYFSNEKREDYTAYDKDFGISVTIPDGYTHIGADAFAKSQIKDIFIPNSVIAIECGAFENNILTNVSIPNSVIKIGGSAFANNQLTSVSIPNSVKVIGDYAFANNQLTNIIIPESVTHIGRNAFAGNLITSVNIPDSVVFICVDSFDMNNLDEESKQRIQKIIDEVVFKECDNLIATIYFQNEVGKAEFQIFMETVNLDYIFIDNMACFYWYEVITKPNEKDKIEKWLEDNNQSYLEDSNSEGFLTKVGYIEKQEYKKLKNKPKKLTVAEYRNLINKVSKKSV